jgi:hypothetical protein
MLVLVLWILMKCNYAFMFCEIWLGIYIYSNLFHVFEIYEFCIILRLYDLRFYYPFPIMRKIPILTTLSISIYTIIHI